MISVSNNEVKRIFLTTNTKIQNLKSKVDIIISPEFYWVRKFEIPVKNETQARHVLPTLFEDVINEDSVLTYQVLKLKENEFLCFAYNNKRIYNAIKDVNIPSSNINSFYFAQNECKGFNSFEVDNIKFMYTSDNVLIKVPNNLLEDVIALEKVIDNIKLSSFKLQIKLYNDVLSSKFYYSLFLIFGVLILLNFFKYLNYSNEIDNLENKIEKTKKVNKLPSSMIQTNSILKKYDITVSSEIKKREAISYIFKNKSFDLKSLNANKNDITLEYLSTNKKEIERFLKKEFKNLSIKQNGFILKVSIKL